jgi:hypothetical protein
MKRPEHKAASGRRHSSPQTRRRSQIGARVVISIEGGLANVIHHTGAPCEVVLRDYDTDGADDERLSTDPDGRKCFETTVRLP